MFLIFSVLRLYGYFTIFFCSCAKKRFFGFAVHFGLRILRSLAFGFRFSSKKQTGFSEFFRHSRESDYMGFLGIRIHNF